MNEPSDQELLARLVRDGSDTALAAIVQRYLPLVFAAARRQVGDPGAAEDVSQAVFIILARKANRLGPPLAGWLLSTTRFCALDAIKRDRRREHHERKAAAMRVESHPAQNAAPPEHELAAQLDAAMARLGETDRNAIALHYLREQPVADVAAAIGLSEPATRKRLERAIHKLRAFLTGTSGEAIPVAVVNRLLMPPSVQSVPPGLAQAVISGAMHATTSMTAASTAALISKGAMKMMTVAKLKVAAALAFALLMVSGAASYGIRRVAAAPNGVPTVGPMPAAAVPAPIPLPAATAVPPEEVGVAIVAVGPFNQADHRWWEPSGGESGFSRARIGLATGTAPGKVLYEIAVRRKPDAKAVYSPVGTEATFSRGDGITYVVIAAAPDQATGAVRFQYAAGPWRVVEQIPVQTTGVTAKSLREYSAAYSGLFQDGNDLNTVIVDNFTFVVQRRFTAIDITGEATTVNPSSFVGVNRMNMSIVTFKNYPQLKMRTLRCEILPDDTWVEFSGISLDGKASVVKTTTGKMDLPAVVKELPSVSESATPKADLP